MRLADQIAQMADPVLLRRADGRTLALPGADTAREAVRRCPTRYVLDGPVTSLCTQIAFDPDGVLGSSVDILRLPANDLWLEFDNAGRSETLIRFALTPPSMPRPQRIGLLLQGRNERSGVVRFFWDNAAGGPEQAPVSAEFDLDDPLLAEDCDSFHRFGVVIANAPQLAPLFRCVRFCVDPLWRDYYRGAAGHAYAAVLQNIVMPLCGDLPVLFALSLLLMTRTALQERASDLSRLNRARQKLGRPPLLDHTQISLNLDASAASPTGGDDSRAPSRLHVVRGHLVRRQAAVFWRRPHMRGDPERGLVSRRSIKLRLTSTPRTPNA